MLSQLARTGRRKLANLTVVNKVHVDRILVNSHSQAKVPMTEGTELYCGLDKDCSPMVPAISNQLRLS